MKSNIRISFFVCCLLLTGSLFFSSCKKATILTCQLGKYFISDGTSTPKPNTFYYYDNGKLKKIAYANSDKDTFYYAADTITILRFDDRDSLAGIFTGITDASGNVLTASKSFYDYFGNITGTDYYTNQYNATQNLTQQNISNSLGTTIVNLVYNGNNTATGTKFIGAIQSEKYVFFHNSTENKTQIADFGGVLIPYFGKPSANLLDSMFVITSSDTIRIKYVHELNENGYTVKTNKTYLSGIADTKYETYSYFNCK